MTVRARLLVTISGIILLLVLPALYGITQLRRVRAIAEGLEEVHADDVLTLGNLREEFAELDRLLRSYVVEPAAEYRQSAETDIAAARGNLRRLSRSGLDGEVSVSRAQLDSLATATARLEELMGSDRRDEATSYLLNDVRPLLDGLRHSLTAVASALDERGKQAVQEAQVVSAAATRTTMLVVTIALFLTIILGLWTTDALSRPLRRLSEATASVAAGDFKAPPHLAYERSDEIGHLSRSFALMTEQLSELDRLKAEFVGLATHELKTPINVIMGYAELMDEGVYGDLPDRQREVTRLIHEQARSLTRLVNQLLDLSRFEAGGLKMEPNPMELAGLLTDVEAAFRALATQKRIQFDVRSEDSAPHIVSLDRDRIRHEVLGNLLSNAFKFTDTGGEISLRAWGEDGNVGLEVSDTGAGIPQDQLQHVFDKYYQVGAEAKAQGSGLGLAIAKQVVEAHHGTISATSTVGRGTTFRITLPAGSAEG